MNAEVSISAEATKFWLVGCLYQECIFTSFHSFSDRCLNAWRMNLWGMHLFCTKYELVFSDAKSRDWYFSATLSSAVRTLGPARGHVVSLKVAWSRFGSNASLLTTKRGSENPFSTLTAHESKESSGKRRQALPLSDTNTFLSLLFWKTSLCLCRNAPHLELCTSKLLRVSLLNLCSLCAFLPHLPNGHPKEETDETFEIFYQICQGVDVERENLWRIKGWRLQKYFFRNPPWWENRTPETLKCGKSSQ